MSSILERKVRGWLSGVIDDMRRSSPVQQWLDSFPADANSQIENTEDQTIKNEEESTSEPDNKETENTVFEVGIDKSHEINLEVPNAKEIWKRKSLESGMLTSTPQRGSIKVLQRDHSVQSDGYAPKLKNPLFRDHSLQVNYNNKFKNLFSYYYYVLDRYEIGVYEYQSN